MIIAITSTGNSDDALFDLRFGRCSYICLLNTDDSKTEFLENEFADQPEEAGIKLVDQLISLGVKRVISGDFGPNVNELLKKNHVQMVVLSEKGASVGDLIQRMHSHG